MKSTRAFTLIELMAVMIILGVLLTLLAPAAMAVKRQTTLASSSNALRQLSIAAQTYLGENNGRFFRSRESLTDGVQWWFGFEGSSGPKTEGQRLLDKSKGPLGPYIADSAGNVPDFAFTSMGASFKPKFKNGYFGFGVNTELTGGPTGQEASKIRQINQLERPGQIALFATSAQINTFQVDGSPPQAFLLFTITGAFAAAGELNVLVRGQLSNVSRIVRHLWRMCMSLFIASGSFFLGQQQVFPQALQGSALLSMFALAPLPVMLFWLGKVRVDDWRRRAKPAALSVPSGP